MKILKSCLIVPVCLLSTMGLFAENEKTVEQLYLQSQVKVKIIKSEADSADREMKKIALQDLEAMISSGVATPDNKEFVEILQGLGSEGTGSQVYENGVLINDFPMIRAESCRLLGQLGGEFARESLIQIMNSETEPMVMSEAIVSLSLSSTKEEDKEVLAVISSAIQSQTALNKDNNFANAYILAVDNIARKSGGITDMNTVNELAKIADSRSGYMTVVRKKALELLKSLQEY